MRLPSSERFFIFSLCGQLRLVKTYAILKPRGICPNHDASNILIGLPLPYPLTKDPLGTITFRFLPLVNVKLFLGGGLRAIFDLISFNLASKRYPTDGLKTTTRFLGTLTCATSINIIIKGRVNKMQLTFIRIP